MKKCQNSEYVIIGFQNNSVSILDLQTCKIQVEIWGQDTYWLDGNKMHCQMLIDDSASMSAYLCPNRQQINFNLFDWHYSCKKVEKLKPQKTLVFKK